MHATSILNFPQLPAIGTGTPMKRSILSDHPPIYLNKSGVKKY